jgi:hypothetical protein
LWTTGLTMLILFFTILLEQYFTIGQLVFLSFWVLINVISTGAMLEKKAWVFYLEYAKVYILMGLLAFSPISQAFIWILLAFLVCLTWYIRPIKEWYVHVVLSV